MRREDERRERSDAEDVHETQPKSKHSRSRNAAEVETQPKSHVITRALSPQS